MNAKEIFGTEFMQAAMKRNYDEMADIYEEMVRYDFYNEIDGFSAVRIENGISKLSSQYCFAEIMPGYKIKLPEKALNYISHFSSEYIYCLEEENIKFTSIDESLGDTYNNLIFDFFEEGGIETRMVEIYYAIYLDEMARRTLGFRIGDIVKIWLLDNMIVVSEIDEYSDYMKTIKF